MLAKTGIKVDLMHKFMPPGPFLVFWQQTCLIHYFRSKTNILGGLAPFYCCTGQIVKTGYRLHTRHSHYSKTFNKGIHTMSFVKRQIAKTSIIARKQQTVLEAETSRNMSFGPTVVDWACSLQKNKKRFRRHKLVPCMQPTLVFAIGLLTKVIV